MTERTLTVTIHYNELYAEAIHIERSCQLGGMNSEQLQEEADTITKAVLATFKRALPEPKAPSET